MNRMIITNNPLVYEKMKGTMEVKFLEGEDYLSVLSSARDRIHLGYSLKTHPLSGSIKPNETPYKSLLISKNCDKLDLQSIYVIEDSIQVTLKFLNDLKPKAYTEKILTDFQVIDYDLIWNAIGSMGVSNGRV